MHKRASKLLAFLLLFCASTASTKTLKPAADEIPNPEAFLGWRDQSQEHGNSDISQFKPVEFKCKNPAVFATHPESNLKMYHATYIGSYNHHKLKGTDEACRVSQNNSIPKERRRCLRPDLLHFHILSDTYKDSCGNVYRGFWTVLFLNKNESMGTLVSKGRTVYARPGAQFKGDFVHGDSYPVSVQDFVFFSEVGKP